MVEIDRWYILINMLSYTCMTTIFCLKVKLVINWRYGLLWSLYLDWRSSVGACAMEFLDLFIVALMPVLKTLLITAIGLLLAIDRIGLLGPEGRHHLNNVSHILPALFLLISMTPMTMTMTHARARTHNSDNTTQHLFFFFVLIIQPNPIN